jgi:predicted PhzF superfamily epimerase YddE/YHI9
MAHKGTAAMNLKLWQIDAFAEKPLEGNPAAVMPLDAWLDDALMQRIANENNLAETAYFVREAPGRYRLRWFTPAVEVPLCGHATLASAWLIFSELAPELQTIDFETLSGTLHVKRGADGRHQMSLPSDFVTPFEPSPDFAQRIGDALDSRPPLKIFKGRNILALFESAWIVESLNGPGDIARLIPPDTGLIATSIGRAGSHDEFDFVSRYFAPHHGIPEDPVTGSAHAALTPFWANALGKKTLKARQVSPRGGNLLCTDDGARTLLSGACALYMTGEISI